MSPTLWLVSTCIGVGVLLALALVYRRAAARRELELAEQLLDAEYDALDRPGDRPAITDRRAPP
ncbi:MAG TPA: hypothetical protein VFQ53_30765 [Kofleriaceae bacterium]|nr:hypothetical protein [Kofleriaceae bacterium]